MPEAPSVPPSLDGTRHLFDALDGIMSRFSDDSKNEYARLGKETFEALVSEDPNEIRRAADQLKSFFKQEAEKISQPGASRTAAPSQPETEPNPTINGNPPDDDTRTGPPGTAHQH